MKPAKTGCDLKTCLLCRLCLKEWLPAIGHNKTNYKVSKGEVIFAEGDELNDIYFIYQGTVKVHKRWGEDKELILRFAKDGDIFGHRGLGKDTFFPVSATAIENSVVCCLSRDFFLSTLKVNNDFLFQLMMFFAAELKESENNMRNLAHMPVKGRIAQSIFTLKEKFGTDDQGAVNIVLSRQDLASYAGTTYETLFRMINEMTAEHAVQFIDKKIRISDEQKLSSYMQQ